jgi:ATP-dependent Lon protease
MTAALVSALLERPVNKDYAMTGEITLTGRVLPIGGLKEKAIAALREKIPYVIIPEKNTKDLEEIPEKIRRKLEFKPVTNMDQVLEMVLLERPGKKGRRGKRKDG